MSIFERIDFPGAKTAEGRHWLMVKFPGDEFNTRSILKVGPGQVAVAVHGGKVEQIFEEGSYTLSTDNYPFIKAFVKKLYGGAVPYSMEIYYFNKTAMNEFRWGTKSEIKIQSPNPADMGLIYGFCVNGLCTMRLKHYQYFLQNIAGGASDGTVVVWEDYVETLRAFISESVVNSFRKYVKEKQVGFAEIQDLTRVCSDDIAADLRPDIESRFGFEMTSFKVAEIYVPDKYMEEYNKQLYEVRRSALQGQLSDTAYARGVQQRQVDVMNTAAGNTSGGMVGTMMGAGMGLGMGFGMMNQAQNAGNLNTTSNPNTPSTAQPAQQVLVVCPGCGHKCPEGTKFCSECGTSMGPKKCECGATLAPGTKFCPECGKKVG